jgi:hypothetical protein
VALSGFSRVALPGFSRAALSGFPGASMLAPAAVLPAAIRVTIGARCIAALIAAALTVSLSLAAHISLSRSSHGLQLLLLQLLLPLSLAALNILHRAVDRAPPGTVGQLDACRAVVVLLEEPDFYSIEVHLLLLLKAGMEIQKLQASRYSVAGRKKNKYK